MALLERQVITALSREAFPTDDGHALPARARSDLDRLPTAVAWAMAFYHD